MTKQMHSVPIRISGLSDGIHEFDREVVPGEIGLPDEFSRPIAAHVHLDKTHSQIILRISIVADATYPCDRCLDPVLIPVKEECLLFYARDIAAAKEMQDDDVRVIDPNEPVIDIGEDIKDIAILGIPMKRTCGEDQSGKPLCKSPIHGNADDSTDESVDPRWEKLKNMHTV